jgi:CheY-like chemotaxis protein
VEAFDAPDRVVVCHQVRTARHILLVEDEPTLQRILGSVLSDRGHRVESVGTAEQALDRLSDAAAPDIDLVLSDKNLPSMNGLELLDQVRAYEKKVKRTVAFVLVTGYPSRDSALAVLAGDGDGYLVKPFRSLSHAVDHIQSILDADLAARRAGGPLARAIASTLSGVPVDVAGAAAAVLVDDTSRAERIRAALAAHGARVVDVDKLPPQRAVLLAGRVEDLQAFARGRAGASLVLVDGGASFSDIVTLIGCGGGAIVDPGLLPAERS